MKIGAQMYTLREHCTTADALKSSLQQVKAMGYNMVQLSGHGADIPVDDIAAMLGEIGLTCGATHISFDDMLEDLDAVIAKHRAWGCSYAGIGGMPARYHGSKEGFLAFAKDVNPVARRLRESGITFIYHNHQFEFMRFDNVCGMDILRDACSPDVMFELDTFWVQTGGGDIVHWIDAMKSRIDVIHFKDMTINAQRQQEMAEIGYGNLNWPFILDACVRSGVKLAFVEQDVCQRSPFESLKMSFDFLKGFGSVEA